DLGAHAVAMAGADAPPADAVEHREGEDRRVADGVAGRADVDDVGLLQLDEAVPGQGSSGGGRSRDQGDRRGERDDAVNAGPSVSERLPNPVRRTLTHPEGRAHPLCRVAGLQADQAVDAGTPQEDLEADVLPGADVGRDGAV